MANFYYNDMEFPQLPSWNQTTYPYACITRYPETGNYILIVTSSRLFYDTQHSSDGVTYYQCIRSGYSRFLKFRVTNGAWVQYTSGTTYTMITEYHHSTELAAGSRMHWTNTDVMVQNSSEIYRYATVPEPVLPTVSSLIPAPMLAGWSAGRKLALMQQKA